MGTSTGHASEGEYIANPRSMTAIAPLWDAAHNLSCLCMTSAYDVAQFVVRAIDMPAWPSEMSICGQRMTVNELLEVVRSCRSKSDGIGLWEEPSNSLQIDNGPASTIKTHQVSMTSFYTTVTDTSDLQYQLSAAQANGEGAKYRRLAPLLATVRRPLY